MQADRHDFTGLAARAHGGERAAADALREALKPEVTRIVKRALRVGKGVSALERLIFTEASLLPCAGQRRPSRGEGERLASQIAQRICAALSDSACRGGAGTRGGLETVYR
jgi:hypothetical protein